MNRRLPQVLLLAVLGCGGTEPVEEIDMAMELPDVTFAKIFDEVIDPAGCTNGYCHGSGAGYLQLTDRQTSYQNLVSAPAFNGACGVELRVSPMDPDQSLLWRKIAPGVSVCEGKMPQGTLGLSNEQADLIHRWIMAGAPE
jgi:predicted CxxxxCH...CXXCH cytochrome family protein